jgi:uncharacterized protein (DUF433 family)
LKGKGCEAGADYNPSMSDPMDWRSHISVDPLVCHGKACIRGTRVMVWVVLDYLAEGETQEAVSAAYRIGREDVQAALNYAAELARERIVRLPSGAT